MVYRRRAVINGGRCVSLLQGSQNATRQPRLPRLPAIGRILATIGPPRDNWRKPGNIGRRDPSSALPPTRPRSLLSDTHHLNLFVAAAVSPAITTIS